MNQFNDIHPDLVREILDSSEAVPEPGLGTLSPEAAEEIIRAYGIPVPAAAVAENAEQAAASALQIGFPVALKVVSAELTHKSDIGGVLLNLENEQEVVAGFETILKKVSQERPQVFIEGVSVQRMITQGQEVIIGAIRDAQFGPLVMFGSGGVEVEGLKDVQFELAPLSREQASDMLDHTWAGRKLRGYRNLQPADREAVLDVILRLAKLVVDFPEISELEINPLRVLEKGLGVVAIDVRGALELHKSPLH